MDHGGGGGGAAPTGCYKCGRPGHWSRDCPSNPNQNPNPNPNSSPNYSKHNSSTFNGGGFGGSKPLQKSSEKPKKVPRARPKLTPELLLSNDGIGYVLRHFPRSFKYRGRGHEVGDLCNLMGLYAEWHSHLLPYYSFDQFIHKVEQVGATRRVKGCLWGSNRGVSAAVEAMNIEEPSLVQEDTSLKNHDTDDLQEDMLQEIYKQTTEGPSPALHGDSAATDTTSHHTPVKDLPNQVNQAPDNMSSISRDLQVSEEQKARMEANRLKALERAAARARSSQTA
ncbi:hypothetical protein TEA_000078 [Camellia sinensis var. sinensis]|uniref:CCHC-type domain-containing protein n=1 Tax=Camellia sinensis var. sinensis TaxID=542762 RepID=A0A4S4E5L0_CAMSN|nr:hypothetical protein TEA_000078 [Camellia sinensis var. sinensis]